MKKIELVAPAGNIEKLKVVIELGADIVYIGGRIVNMKFGTENFSDEDLLKSVAYTHSFGKKIYVSLNAVPHNDEIELLPEYIKFLEKANIDGVIISDLGVFQCTKEFSKLPITVETHSSNTNWYSVKMWKDLGADTIVVHRDVTLENMNEIRQKVPNIKLEVAIHGPINMAISARPLISNYIIAKNLKEDTQRNDYTITEETRPGEYMPIFEDKYGTSIFSGRDTCGIEVLFDLLEIGVDKIKIQGGMKDEKYLRVVTEIYREALDEYKNEENPKLNISWLKKLQETTDKPFISIF